MQTREAHLQPRVLFLGQWNRSGGEGAVEKERWAHVCEWQKVPGSEGESAKQCRKKNTYQKRPAVTSVIRRCLCCLLSMLFIIFCCPCPRYTAVRT